MRREIRARWLAALTAAAVIALAALFAALRNVAPAPAGGLPNARVATVDYISLQSARAMAAQRG